MLLYGHIGQVNKHVVKLPSAVVVLDGAEPTEALTAPAYVRVHTHLDTQHMGCGVQGATVTCSSHDTHVIYIH